MTYTDVICKAVTESQPWKCWHPIVGTAASEKPMHFTWNWLPVLLSCLLIATPYGMEFLCIKGMNKVVLKGGLGTSIHPLCSVISSLKTFYQGAIILYHLEINHSSA